MEQFYSQTRMPTTTNGLTQSKVFLKPKYKDDNIHKWENKVIEKNRQMKDRRIDIISYSVPSLLKSKNTYDIREGRLIIK